MAAGPPRCFGQGVRREQVQVRGNREVGDSQRSIVPSGHSTKYSPIRGVVTMLPALTPTQTVPGSNGSRSARTGLSHPVAQVRRTAAVDQEHVGLADPGNPPVCADGGQCGELEDPEGGPAQAGEVLPRGSGRD
jgi:hypothetical protein